MGLALAMHVEGHHDPTEPEYVTQRRRDVLFYVSGLVVLTLLINGTLINMFYAKVTVWRSGGLGIR